MIKIINHNNDRDTIIIYIENVISDTKILKYLEKMDDFEGAEKYTHRLQKWYQREKLYFSNKWKNQSYRRWVSKEYDEYLLEVQEQIQNITNKFIPVKFNSCLINKYRDGSDIIKPHRDAIESFGEYPVISNLSIGSERTIKFEGSDSSNSNDSNDSSDSRNSNDSNDSSDSNAFDINLKSGSLLIMSGSSQKYFKHSIPESANSGIRYSMTFREYITE